MALQTAIILPIVQFRGHPAKLLRIFVFFDERDQGQNDVDLGSLSRLGLDGGGAAEQPCPLANPPQTEVAGLDLLGIETDAPVLDVDLHSVVVGPNSTSTFGLWL